MIYERLFPRIHTKPVGIRGNSFRQFRFPAADRGNFRQQRRIRHPLIRILDRRRTAPGNFFHAVKQFFLGFQRQRFQFRKTDIRILRFGGAGQAQCNIRRANGGMFQQTFIDMSDLFHIQRPVREQDRSAGLFQHLQGGQKQQYGTVVNGKRRRVALFPACSLGAAFQKRIFVRVEERTAQSGKPHLRMFNSAIDRPEYREQSRPRIVTTFQNFRSILIGLHRQLAPQCGNRVTLIVGFAA